MVNLEGYKETDFIGKITGVAEQPLRDFLGDRVTAFKKGMTRFPTNVVTEQQREEYRQERLDRDVLVITYEIEANGETISNSEFFTIPSIKGWGRSKLKALKEKNSFNADTDTWLNQNVKVSMNKDGYLRLLE